MLFDLLIDPKDESKALAIYNRFLRSIPAQQAPERVARYAFLQQRQNRADEAVEQYNKAGELFVAAGRDDDALFCWERIARLEPDNLARQIKLAEGAGRPEKNALRSEEHTSELQSRGHLVCRLLLEKINRDENTDS